VRHGEAHSVDVDPQQALTENGKAGVSKMAKYLSDCKIHIAQIMHSPKNRAKQTAEIFATELQSDCSEVESILSPEADVGTMLDYIKNLSSDTMLVTHLPFIAKLLSALVINDENFYPLSNFVPCTAVCLEYYQDQRYIINWLLRPSIINIS